MLVSGDDRVLYSLLSPLDIFHVVPFEIGPHPPLIQGSPIQFSLSAPSRSWGVREAGWLAGCGGCVVAVGFGFYFVVSPLPWVGVAWGAPSLGWWVAACAQPLPGLGLVRPGCLRPPGPSCWGRPSGASLVGGLPPSLGVVCVPPPGAPGVWGPRAGLPTQRSQLCPMAFWLKV